MRSICTNLWRPLRHNIEFLEKQVIDMYRIIPFLKWFISVWVYMCANAYKRCLGSYKPVFSAGAGVILIPRGHLAMCRDIFGCHNQEVGACYWNLVTRDPGGYKISHSTQNGTPSLPESFPAQNVHSAAIEKPCHWWKWVIMSVSGEGVEMVRYLRSILAFSEFGFWVRHFFYTL